MLAGAFCMLSFTVTKNFRLNILLLLKKYD